MALREFSVLGPLEVRCDGEPVAIPAPKQRALLGLLLLHANEPVSQEVLIDQLWGADAPPTARASLQNQVHALRKLLGAETLVLLPSGYVVHVERDELDLERFERLVADARSLEPKERAEKLREALNLWRGPPLVEFPSEPFMQSEISRLEEERLSALEERIEAELELGRHPELVPELESLVHLYPLRERIWGQLMLALYRDGRQADAAAVYRRARETLLTELGIEPSVDLRELQRAILLQDARLDDPEHDLGWALERAAAILPWQPGVQAESLYEYALALIRTGEPRRGIAALEAAGRMALEAGDVSVDERTRLYLSYFAMWTEGTSESAFLEEARSAGERFEERGDEKGLAVALRHQYQTLLGMGQADAAARLTLHAAELAARRDDAYEEAAALMSRAEALAWGSAPVGDAIAECELMLEEGERRGMWSPLPLPLRLLGALGTLCAQAGRVDDARRFLDTAITEARGAGLLWFVIGLTDRRAEAELIVGDRDEAEKHLRLARSLIEIEVDHRQGPGIAAALALLLAVDGDIQEARQLAFEARADAATEDFYTEIAWRHALALVAARERRFDEAVRLSDEARVRAEACDSLTFRGQTLEEAALVRRLARDFVGEAVAAEHALALYEQKGNVMGAARVRQQLARR